jgi:hypothetical protein
VRHKQRNLVNACWRFLYAVTAAIPPNECQLQPPGVPHDHVSQPYLIVAQRVEQPVLLGKAG